MINRDNIYIIFNKMWNDKAARMSAFMIMCLIFLLTVFFSALTAAVVAVSYALGCAVCLGVIVCRDKLSCYLPLVSKLLGYKDLAASVALNSPAKQCSLCGKGKCSRHRPRLSREPWRGLTVHKDLDTAIQRLYDKILNTFVLGWFRGLSQDKRFESSLRLCFRHASSVLLRRLIQNDLPYVLTERLLPATLSHLNAVSKVIKAHPLLGEYSPSLVPLHIHPALHSREAELQYLKSLSACLMPLIICPDFADCSNFHSLMQELLSGWVLLPLTDCLSDPAVINNIVISALQHRKTKFKNNRHISGRKVEFLHDFAMEAPRTNVHESSALSVLLKTPQQLYAFMQFLKRGHCVHLLQFCLQVDDLNALLVQPEASMDTDTSSRLHKELAAIHRTYLTFASSDFLGDTVSVNPNLVLQVEAIIPHVTDKKARTVGMDGARPIYQIYDIVYGYLEGLLDEFYSSPEYFELMYGPRSFMELNKMSTNKNRKASDGQVGAVSRLGHRIRGALRVGPVEGQLPPSGPLIAMPGWTVQVHATYCEQPYSRSSGEVVFRLVVHSPNGSGMEFPFQSWGELPESSHWSLKRKESDFHALKTQLGLMGEWDDLPDLKSCSIDHCKVKYQMFVQALLQCDTLTSRQTDLLYNFLAPTSETSQSLNSLYPSVNIYQSVTQKLRKERGQHLEHFISALMQSVESKQSSGDAPVGEEPSTDKTRSERGPRHNSVFGDHFKCYLDNPDSSVTDVVVLGCTVRGPSQCLLFIRYGTSRLKYRSEQEIYIVVRMFLAPWWLVRFTLACCCVLGSGLDGLSRAVLHCMLSRTASQPRIAQLINYLTVHLFGPRTPHLTKEELLQRRDLARLLLKQTPPAIINGCWPGLGEGLADVIDALQYPNLNKQLVYTLLDIVVSELFPEINQFPTKGT